MSEGDNDGTTDRRDFLKLASVGTLVGGAALVADHGTANALEKTAQANTQNQEIGHAETTPNLSAAQAKKLSDNIRGEEPDLIKLFEKIHQNPELGFVETETAKIVADELTRLGYEVHAGIGKTGVAGVLRNGEGPTIMFRADMDALPIKEDTGLPYASTKIMHDRDGIETSVMHACGHDAHTVWLFALAKQMVEFKGQWAGTLVLVAQPAEELIEGATAMVNDGLYDRVPKPELVIAGHTHPVIPAGSVAIAAGDRMAGTDQIDVKIFGVGGHGSQPNTTKDPVVMSALAIMAYQGVSARVVDQYQPAVLTVGAMQSGTSNNIIPDEAILLINLRWYAKSVRDTMIKGIRSVTDNIANMYNMPADRMPTYTFKGYAGPLVNGEDDVVKARAVLKTVFGDDRVLEGLPPVMGSEDFQNLVSDIPGARSLFVEIGSGKPDVYTNLKKGKLPDVLNHNPRYIVEQGAVAAGALALTAVVMEYLRPVG